MMKHIWDFFQNQILGMKWLNQLLGQMLSTLGLDVTGKVGGSIQFFLYDTIKILVLLGVLIFIISYIQSYFPPERSKKIAFICVHNSCRSQMAEAFGKVHLSNYSDCYSAGTETKPEINQDAIRIMKERFGIDMSGQYSKLISDIPTPDIVITMGCNVHCPHIPCSQRYDWGLKDPTGKNDDAFIQTAEEILKNILALK